MRNKYLEIILAAGLVFLIPGVICSIMLDLNADAQENRQTLVSNPLDTVPTAAEHLKETSEECISITVLDLDGSVRQMELDAYLTSVLLCEMPAEFEFEALKAQAVVARTYALKKATSGGKHLDAAVCMDPSCCQGFFDPVDYLGDGGQTDLLGRIRQAVEETKDMVLVYEGKLIDATYFSCSGGRTENAVAVWGSDIPYLQSVESPGEEAAEHYTDTVSFSKNEFGNILNIDPETMVDSWITNISYTDGGGVEALDICGKTYTGTQLRQLLGLRSTAFAITSIGQSVTITTKGFGHRVGMSQYGAEAMAISGSDYREILMHYYQGVTLTSYNG